MIGFRRRKRPPKHIIADKNNSNSNFEPTIEIIDNQPTEEIRAPSDELSLRQDCFSGHISKYTGQTVTVFVKSGGFSGLGFTGILLRAGKGYIELIIKPGPPPACPLGNACTGFNKPSNLKICQKYRFRHYSGIIRTLGSIVCIPIDKIASFVHNSV